LTDLPGLLSRLIGVFGLAFFSFSYAILAGLALGLGPVVIAVTAWASYTLGVVLAILLGDPVRKRLLARFGGKLTSNPHSAVRRAWDRYGLIGLSLLAPMTTGAQIGAILGLSLGVPPRRLAVGLALGGALWSIGLTAAATLGVTALQSLR
jgi:uncharacterized membrane protein